MIELRWLTKEVEVPGSRRSGEGGTSWAISKERVLQYRVRTNPLEEGLQEPLWSDWQDVFEDAE